MTSLTSPYRRGHGLLALLAALVTVTLAVVAVPWVAPTASATAGATTAVRTTTVPHTTITLLVPRCEGCRIRIYQGLKAADPSQATVWISREKQVVDGQVSWFTRTSHTRGMSVTVVAPWEGNPGYVTTVAFRYGREQVGDWVDFAEARTKQRATACWAGTDRDRVTLRIHVRRVLVPGNVGTVPGSIAWTPRTQRWLPPMRAARDGVLGSQDVNLCG